MTFFKILSLFMVFGHPTSSWQNCGTLPMSTAMGPIGTLNCFFWPKIVIFCPKNSKFRTKNGKYRPKSPPEVADGRHGGLGRVQKGKNGLEVEPTF